MSLAGYSPRSHKESDTTKWLILFTFLALNRWGTPLYQSNCNFQTLSLLAKVIRKILMDSLKALFFCFFFYFSKVSSKCFLIKHCRVKRVLWVLLKSSYVLLFVSLQSFRYPYSNPSKESNNLRPHGGLGYSLTLSSLQFSSVTQSCSTLCDPMDHSTPGLPVHHQLPELTQTPVHWVGDAIQPSHPLSSPSPPAFNLSQHQGLFKWVSSSIDTSYA